MEPDKKYDPPLSVATLDEIFAEVKARSGLVVCFITARSPEGEGWTWARYLQGETYQIVAHLEVEKQDLINDLLKGRQHG